MTRYCQHLWINLFRAVCTIVLCFLSSTCSKTNPYQRPNFLILFADDMGYGDVSFNGHPTIYTPNLDKLAYEGMRFTQFSYCLYYFN